MKVKVINKIIQKKFSEFTASIKDEHVRKLVEDNTIITGGCITSMLLKEKVNDFDLYFTNRETVISACNYFLKIFNEKNGTSGKLVDGMNWKITQKNFTDEQLEEIGDVQENRIKIFFSSVGVGKEIGLDADEIHELGDTIEIKNDEGELYRPVYISSNAITLSGGIQIVIRFYGEADEIHDNYDFVHCTNYWLSKDSKVFLNQKALESIIAKDLFYIGSKYPLASIIRIRKFVSRGWTINAGQILKMCLQLNEFDLYDPKVLEDQLVGVDLAYFARLIEAIKEGSPEKVNYEYVSTIIDRIF